MIIKNTAIRDGAIVSFTCEVYGEVERSEDEHAAHVARHSSFMSRAEVDGPSYRMVSLLEPNTFNGRRPKMRARVEIRLIGEHIMSFEWTERKGDLIADYEVVRGKLYEAFGEAYVARSDWAHLA